MQKQRKRIRDVIVSVLKYYGVVICTFAISVPLLILLFAVGMFLSDVITSPEGVEVDLYPLLLGICFVLMIPIIIIGLVGNYFLLFFKYRPRSGAHRGRERLPSRSKMVLRRIGGGRSVSRPFVLPPVSFSIILLLLLIMLSIPSYALIVVGLAFFNPLTFFLILFGAIIFIVIFPILFTFPPLLWIEVLQKGKSLVLAERSILLGLVLGMFSPVPVIFFIFIFDVIYFNTTGYVFPKWVDTALMAPIVEEFFKALGLVILFSRIRNQYDGLVLGFCCGIGFAVVENLLYFSDAALTGLNGGIGEAIVSWAFVTTVRSLKSTMSHGIGTALIGFCLGYYRKGLGKGRTLWFLPVLGYSIAVVLHAVWNGLLVFVETKVPEGLQDSWLLNGGMIVWIICFFFMELFLLLLLKYVGRTAEDKDIEEGSKEKRPGPHRSATG